MIDAPKALASWLIRGQARFLSHGIACDLRTPLEATDTSKAIVRLDAGVVIGTITVWATGMIEFIAMNRRTRAELAVRDLEVSSEFDPSAVLLDLLDDFIELVSVQREE